MKNLLCMAVFLVSATALRADVFSFSYAGSGVTESGTITATLLGAGQYLITDASGNRNGVSIDIPLGGGTFNYTSPTVSSGSITFSVGGILGGLDSVTWGAGLDTESYSSFSYPFYSGNTTGNFTLSRGLPEPATLSLLLVMGLGVWALMRKPSKNTPTS